MTEESFSERLIRCRAQKGLSQVELAALAGVAPAQISRYESGKHVPRPHVAARLAEALGCSVAWLFEGGVVGSPGALTVVEYTPREDGGAEVSVDLSATAMAALQKTSDQLGISKERLLKAFVLEGLAERARKDMPAVPDVDIEAIARRVLELLDKDRTEPV